MTKMNKCKNCEKSVGRIGNIYCSQICSSKYVSMTSRQKVLSGEKTNWRQIKKYLLSMDDRCSQCGITEWNGKPIHLECDHIDGDITNDRLSNARILCPNCHSQTDTYKTKNIDNPNGKEKRRERYFKSIKPVATTSGIKPEFFL